MQKKGMTITMDDVVSDDLADGYRAMAQDTAREQEALAWSEVLIGDATQSSKAMADQLTTVAKERLTTRAGVLTRADLKGIEHAIKIQLGLPL